MSRPAGPRLVAASLLALPVVELAVLVQVGRRLGVPGTIALVLASSVLGLIVLRRAGRAALADLAVLGGARPGGPDVTVDESGRVVREDRPRPSGQLMADRATTGLAGLLLAVPGLVSSVVGLVLLLPGARPAVRTLARRAVRRRQDGPGARATTVQVISVDTTGEDPAGDEPAADRLTHEPPAVEPRAEDGTGFDGGR